MIEHGVHHDPNPVLMCLFGALLGVVTNLRFPKFDYINETAVIKNSLSVVIAMFGSWGVLAAPGVLFHWGTTPQTALAASVLFLIPGIPLINAMLDIMDGHALMGFARAVQASILIACIALGLALTMALLGVSSL